MCFVSWFVSKVRGVAYQLQVLLLHLSCVQSGCPDQLYQ
jgi:hypothetical protein